MKIIKFNENSNRNTKGKIELKKEQKQEQELKTTNLSESEIKNILNMQKRKKIFNNILELIIPNHCGFCISRGKNCLCTECYNMRSYMFNTKILVDTNMNTKVLYLAKYKREIKYLIEQIKFFDKPYLIRTILEFVKNDKKYINFISDNDYITYVPTDFKTLFNRGYNQAEKIVDILTETFVLKKEYFCEKNKETKKQKNLTRKERFENIEDMFTCKIKGKEGKLLIVDDIYSTGATLYAMYKEIKKYNPKLKISIFVLAYNRYLL